MELSDLDLSYKLNHVYPYTYVRTCARTPVNYKGTRVIYQGLGPYGPWCSYATALEKSWWRWRGIPWAFSFVPLHENVPESLDSIPLETIQNYIQRSRNYMFAYLGGNKPGTDMEKIVNKLGKAYKSHRHVGVND